jgi:hypothetical protein
VVGPDEVAWRLQCRRRGWVVWFGRHTCRYWALAYWARTTGSLLEAATPDALDAAIASFELLHRKPEQR